MKKLLKGIKNKNGFSLVELIVVIAIMVVLLSLLVPSVLGYIESACNAADVSNAKTMCESIQINLAVASPDKINLASNPWGGGSANSHGYIYVDNDEIRTSSIEIAKILEENHILKPGAAENANMYGSEPRFSGDSVNVLCRSQKTWDRYQINFTGSGRSIKFTYIATRNGSHQDSTATNAFAKMIGGEPAPSTISMGEAD